MKISFCRAALAIGTITLSLASGLNSHPVSADTSLTILPGHIRAEVLSGRAALLGRLQGDHLIYLRFVLVPRDRSGLTRYLADVTNRRSLDYEHYMTPTQVTDRFYATSATISQVADWLAAGHFKVRAISPRHLFIDAAGTFLAAEQLLHITINDYVISLGASHHTFYSANQDPSVPTAVAPLLTGITGLDDFPHFMPHSKPLPAVNIPSSPPYYPQNFAQSYDVNPLYNNGYSGTGQRIGIIYFQAPPSTATLNAFSSTTGVSVATQANNRLHWIQVASTSGDGAGPDTSSDDESAIDVEYASGMAPAASLDYYEVPTVSGSYIDKDIQDALTAANNGSDAQISISFFFDCEINMTAASRSTYEQFFENGATTGHTYFVASGDLVDYCGSVGPGNKSPEYPATSVYVVSVGGTTLHDNGGTYTETAWGGCYSSSSCISGAGGGASVYFAAPSWQTPYSPTYREYPDVAADADPGTGAYLCSDQYGCGAHVAAGTSIAAPLWAGMLADINQYLVAMQGRNAGFIAPAIWDFNTYSNAQYVAFHDITTATGPGPFPKPPQVGWDGITGWGSPDAWNLGLDLAGTLKAAYSPSSPSSTYPASTSVTATITLTNQGTATWLAKGPPYFHLGVHFASTGGGYPVSGNDNTWITDQHLSLPSNVVPGGSLQVTLSLQTPSTAGNYVLEYEMVEENTAWFHQYWDSNVTVGTYSAQYTPVGQPSSFTHGQTASYQVTVINNGTANWTTSSPDPMHLGVHFASSGGCYPASGNDGTWPVSYHFALPANVSAGQSTTFSISVNPPSTPGTYVLEYEMVQENVEWFPQCSDYTVHVY